MCLQCCTKAVRYEQEVVPGYILTRATQDYYDEWKKDEWGLVFMNDPEFIWAPTPILDPCFGMSDEELDAAPLELDEAFMTALSKFEETFVLDPYRGWKLMEAAKKAGYDPETFPRFGGWLFHRMAEVIRDSKLMDDYANQRNQEA